MGDAVNQKKNNNKKLSKALSTNLSIDDETAFVIELSWNMKLD
jgi:hypothetical protein